MLSYLKNLRAEFKLWWLLKVYDDDQSVYFNSIEFICKVHELSEYLDLTIQDLNQITDMDYTWRYPSLNAVLKGLDEALLVYAEVSDLKMLPAGRYEVNGYRWLTLNSKEDIETDIAELIKLCGKIKELTCVDADFKDGGRFSRSLRPLTMDITRILKIRLNEL